MIYDQIRDDLKEAMKSQDKVRLSVVRGLLAAFTNELVAKRRKPTEVLSDDETISVMRREARKRKEAIDGFMAGGSAKRADDEAKELAIIETYLPSLMTTAQIKLFVEKKLANLEPFKQNQVGQLLGIMMKDLKGKADAVAVKNVLEEILRAKTAS